ncbi:hypothetical protein, partial [Butyribacter sp.]|uniref:hypothetical protein n=1 Tax=Butyribacter sp. TaxID=2822465 RepID=UPI002A9B7867|nr:hypothetical protein [Butyribacter sp.]
MNRLKEKIKKKWKVMTGLTVMFVLVFLVGFAVKAHFTTKAADADKPVYTITDDEGRNVQSSMSVRRVTSKLSVAGAKSENTTYTWNSKNDSILVLGAGQTDTV